MDAARWWAVARLFWLRRGGGGGGAGDGGGVGGGAGAAARDPGRGDRTKAAPPPTLPLPLPRGEAALRLAAVLALQVLRGKAGTVLAASTRDVLAAAGTDKLGPALARKLGLLLLLSPLDAVYEHVLRGLRAAWSTHLTNHLLRDYMDLACARLQGGSASGPGDLDAGEELTLNVDQHVAEGVDKFVNLSLDLLLESVQAGIHLYFFTRMLAGPSLALASTSRRLALLGTVATLFVGRKLPALYRLERDATNDFRYALTRAVDNAESIAFYDGAAQEVATLRERHRAKQDRGWARSQQRDLVQAFSSTFRKIAGLVPFAALAKTVEASSSARAAATALVGAQGHSHASSHGHSHSGAHGHAHSHDHDHDHNDCGNEASDSPATPSSASSQLAIVLQASEAFDEVLFHLMILAENINDFSRLKAVTDQLYGMLRVTDSLDDREPGAARLETATDRHDLIEHPAPGHWPRGGTGRASEENKARQPAQRPGAQPWLELRDLTLRFRDRVLIEKLSVALEQSDRLLITGGSGFGKTSLLRCIQGLAMDGAGTIVRPPKRDIMFIPQQPYMTLGSLREQLFYPTPRDEVPQDRDAEAMRILHVVGLGHVAQRCFEGLDTVARWPDELSVGEQQRVAFCRIALRRPRFVFLDEATSALDMAAEDRMHQLLADSCQAYVSVGHRATLEKYHSHKLTLRSKGRWDLEEIDASQSRRSSLQEDHADEDDIVVLPSRRSRRGA